MRAASPLTIGTEESAASVRTSHGLRVSPGREFRERPPSDYVVLLVGVSVRGRCYRVVRALGIPFGSCSFRGGSIGPPLEARRASDLRPGFWPLLLRHSDDSDRFLATLETSRWKRSRRSAVRAERRSRSCVSNQGGVIEMAQLGQVVQMRSKAAGGEALWGYCYRVGGRGSRRVQRGGFQSERDAGEALERALERLRRANGTASTLTASPTKPTSTRWTSRGHCSNKSSPPQPTEEAPSRRKNRSPLTDSNRRPPPYHALRNRCRGLPPVADRLV
jgi:hypothetical protein